MEKCGILKSISQVRVYGVNGQVRPTPEIPELSALDVRNVSYEVKEISEAWWRRCLKKTTTRMVLTDINMRFTSGQITAIVGSSGSGKTSLLDVISCRADGTVTGNVYFRNQECTRTLMTSCASYVMQSDRLLPHLTVRECLTYTAYLKLPDNTTKKQIQAKVSKVVNDLGLKLVADAKIGGSVERGISGGERRRVTIAIQLLQEPDILLLDEPTTGLDSFTARYLVKNLRQLALSGKIVVMTIHQPRSDIFKLFDQVAILSQGEITYSGPTSYLVPYFNDINYPCPTYCNPIDIYVDVSSINRKSKEEESRCRERVRELVEVYRHSPTYRQILQEMNEDLSKPVNLNTNNVKPSRPGVFRVLSTLYSRFNVNLWRDHRTHISRFLMFPFYVFFICVFLGRLGHDQKSIQDRLGLLYQAISSPMFIALINAIQMIPPLRDLYYREARDGLYSIILFIIAYTLHIFPYILVSSTIFVSALYWICSLHNDLASFGMFVAVVFMMHYAGEMLTLVGLGFSHNSLIANSFIGLYMSLICLISAGLIRTFSSLPIALQWVARISLPRYGAEIIANNEFHTLNFTCTPDQPCNYPDGETFLRKYFPDSEQFISRDFGIMVGYFFFLMIFSMVAFKVRGIPNLQ